MRNPVVEFLFTAVTVVVGLSGCINADPSDFTVRDAATTVPRSDADLGDATADVADPQTICRACVEAPEDPGPGCGAAVAPCLADKQCTAINDCCFAQGCWMKGTQQDIITCAIPCFVMNGVADPADPVVMLTAPITQCALTTCQAACGVSP